MIYTVNTSKYITINQILQNISAGSRDKMLI